MNEDEKSNILQRIKQQLSAKALKSSFSMDETKIASQKTTQLQKELQKYMKIKQIPLE